MCFGQLLSNRKILILCLNGNSHRKKTLFDLKISNDLFDGTFTVTNEPPSIFADFQVNNGHSDFF